jgi:hypothetical protein
MKVKRLVTSLGECFFQPTFTNKTPGANGVKDDVDAHT